MLVSQLGWEELGSNAYEKEYHFWQPEERRSSSKLWKEAIIAVKNKEKQADAQGGHQQHPGRQAVAAR